jgi:hypothetical protein
MEYPGIDPNTLLASMGNKKDDNNTMLFVLLLLFLGGRRGLGGTVDGEGIRSNATQNDIAQQTQFLASGHSDINDHISRVNNTMDLNALNLTNRVNQVESTTLAAICECCCKLGVGLADVGKSVEVSALNTVNAVERGNASIENTICNQTNTLLAKGTADTQRIIDAINAQTVGELEQKLADCKAQLSNATQTQQIEETIRRMCHPHPWPFPPVNGNGNGGVV